MSRLYILVTCIAVVHCSEKRSNMNLLALKYTVAVAFWPTDDDVVRVNEVTLRRARLVPSWCVVGHLGQLSLWPSTGWKTSTRLPDQASNPCSMGLKLGLALQQHLDMDLQYVLIRRHRWKSNLTFDVEAFVFRVSAIINNRMVRSSRTRLVNSSACCEWDRIRTSQRSRLRASWWSRSTYRRRRCFKTAKSSSVTSYTLHRITITRTRWRI